MTKHRGGRGRRAKNKYQTITISLPPETKSLLDSWVTDDLSRSEIVSQLIQAHAQAEGRAENSKGNNPQPSSKASLRPSESLTTPKQVETKSLRKPQGKSERLAYSVPVLHVMQRTMPRGQKWTPAKYAEAEALLAQGDTLTARGVDYVTEQGQVMNWRMAEALVKLKILNLKI